RSCVSRRSQQPSGLTLIWPVFPAVMQKSTRRLQRQKLGRSAHWKVLLIIFLVVSVPTIGTILLVSLSSRPSLSDRTFPSSGDRQDADILDWPKLYSLNDRAPGADRLLQSVAGSDVRVPG